MAENTILNKVKLALRLTHNVLDTDIQDNIDSAKEELIRLGINPTLVNAEMPSALILTAIKSYCASYYVSDHVQAEKYLLSFEHIAEQLRKSAIYGEQDAE